MLLQTSNERELSCKNLPVLTSHGNPPLAIGGAPVATGEGKLDYMKAFPPVVHRWTIGANIENFENENFVQNF